MNEEPKQNSPSQSESRSGSVTVPVWLFIVAAVLGFRGCISLEEQGGNFSAQVYAPYTDFKQVDDLQPVDTSNPLVKRGKAVFSTYCAPCHQPSGSGAPGVAPPLTGSEWVNAAGPNRVIRIVLDGLQGPVTVKGQEWNLAMLAWKGTLTDDADIAAVLTYIRGNKDWGNNAPPVTPAEVSAIRKETESKTGSWTADELLKIADK